MNTYNTSYIQNGILISHQCIYCGKDIKEVEDFYSGSYESDTYYPCTCEGALKEQELLRIIKNTKHQLEVLQFEAYEKNKVYKAMEKAKKELGIAQQNPLLHVSINLEE